MIEAFKNRSVCFLFSAALLVGCEEAHAPNSGAADESDPVDQPVEDHSADDGGADYSDSVETASWELVALDPVYQELETQGLVHDEGYTAYALSFGELSERVFLDGDAEVADLMIREGLLWNSPEKVLDLLGVFVKSASRSRSKLQAVIDKVRAADTLAALAQWDVDARRRAADQALSKVPAENVKLVSKWCGISRIGDKRTARTRPLKEFGFQRGPFEVYSGLPLYLVNRCVEIGAHVVKQFFGTKVTGPGPAQLGVWDSPSHFGLVAITATGDGGAAVCEIELPQGNEERTTVKSEASFSDRGLLTISDQDGRVRSRIFVQGGEDRLLFHKLATRRQAEYSRAAATEKYLGALKDCL